MHAAVVDENNKIIGSASDEEIYSKKLHHRTVHIIACNDKGELFLSQLSAHDVFCPGYWCTSAHGILLQNETYEQAAERSLKNWLGVNAQLVKIHEGSYDHYKMRKFMQVFRCNTNNILLNPGLAMNGKWFSVDDVRDMVKKNQMVHPELAYVIEKLYPE